MKYRVAIIREEGSNGDREMAAAMYAAGFELWDVHVRDLLSGRITLEGFLLKMLVGRFSYADVLESARGWAAMILFNKELKAQFVNMRVEKSNAIMLKGSTLGVWKAYGKGSHFSFNNAVVAFPSCHSASVI